MTNIEAATAAYEFLRKKFPNKKDQPFFFRVATLSSHRDFATKEEGDIFATALSVRSHTWVTPVRLTLFLFHGEAWHPSQFEASTYIRVAEHHGWKQ